MKYKLSQVSLSILALCLINILLSLQAIACSSETAGGNLTPYVSKSVPIKILKEIIQLNVYKDKTEVNVTYYLINKGEIETIEFGTLDFDKTCHFDIDPITNKVIDPTYNYPSYCDGAVGIGQYNDFKINVNGEDVEVVSKSQETDILGVVSRNQEELLTTSAYETWLTFFAKLPSNKTSIIKNSYWVKNKLDYYYGYDKHIRYPAKTFHFDFTPDYAWKGKIEKIIVQVDLKDNLSVSNIDKKYSTKGLLKLSPTTAKWEFKNIKSPNSRYSEKVFELEFLPNYYDLAKTKYLTESDLEGFQVTALDNLTDEIYARHGKKINGEILKKFSWYKENPQYNDDLLNEFEKKNIEFITKYKNSLNINE